MANPFDPFGGYGDLFDHADRISRELNTSGALDQIQDAVGASARLLEDNAVLASPGSIASLAPHVDAAQQLRDSMGLDRIEREPYLKEHFAELSLTARDIAENVLQHQPVLDEALSAQYAGLLAHSATSELLNDRLISSGFLSAQDQVARGLIERLNGSIAGSRFLFYAPPRRESAGDDEQVHDEAEREEELAEANDKDYDEKLTEVVPAHVLAQVKYLAIDVLRKLRNDPRLMRGISPRDFEKLIAEILDGLGYKDVFLTKQSGDGGFDVYATRRDHGLSTIFGFECKRFAESRKVGVEVIRSLNGALDLKRDTVNTGVLITTSYFTKGARGVLCTRASLEGKDFNDVVDLFQEYAQKRPFLFN